MRHDNWPTLLSDFIERSVNRPFEWGVSDCTLFAASAAAEMTGVDFAKALRGKYSSARGAQRLMDEAGGLSAILLSTGLEEVQPLCAQRGDAVMVETDGREALGVIGMDGGVVCQGPDGLTFLPIDRALRAWRV